MRRERSSYGYLRPSAESMTVTNAAWAVNDARISVEDEEGLDAVVWDIGLPLEFSCILDVDLPSVLQQCGLPVGSTLRAAVIWHSNRTSRHGASPLSVLTSGENPLLLSLDGSEIGGTLTVDVRVSLDHNSNPSANALAASRPGSVLWEQTFSLVIEGSGSRVPTVACDLGAAGCHAMWRIEVASNLETPASAGFNIVLNTSNAMTLDMLKKKPTSTIYQQWKYLLAYDTKVHLIAHAATIDSEALSEYEDREGTLGFVLAALIREVSPSSSDVQHFADDFRRNPSAYFEQLQGGIYC